MEKNRHGFLAEICTGSCVRALGAHVLRIEMFAEPLFAASIVASGALRGAGDTFIPGILNLVSMWGCRIVLIMLLVPHFGLSGAWIAMCAELCCRGVLFLIRVKQEHWLRKMRCAVSGLSVIDFNTIFRSQ